MHPLLTTRPAAAFPPVLPRLEVHADWLASLAAGVPQGLRQAMMAHPAMRPRLLARFYRRWGIHEPDPHQLGPDGRRILGALTANRQRFCMLAGLIWHGRALGRAITPDLVRPLLATFSPEDIALAVSMKLYAPLRMAAGPLTPAGILQAGEELLRAWAKAMGPGIARLVALMLAPRAHEPPPDWADPAVVVLGALAYRLTAQQQGP
jgi:hypothetical protein